MTSVNLGDFDWMKSLQKIAAVADIFGEVVNMVDECEFVCPLGKKAGFLSNDILAHRLQMQEHDKTKQL